MDDGGGYGATPGVAFMDFHCHTNASFDSLADPLKVVQAARARGITHLAITDHDRIDGALRAREAALPGITVIVGEEVKTAGGDLVCLFLEEAIPPGLSPAETIARARAQGALVGIPHPFDQYRGSIGKAEDEIRALAALVDWVEAFNARVVFRDGNERAAELARYGRDSRRRRLGRPLHCWRSASRRRASRATPRPRKGSGQPLPRRAWCPAGPRTTPGRSHPWRSSSSGPAETAASGGTSGERAPHPRARAPHPVARARRHRRAGIAGPAPPPAANDHLDRRPDRHHHRLHRPQREAAGAGPGADPGREPAPRPGGLRASTTWASPCAATAGRCSCGARASTAPRRTPPRSSSCRGS